MTPNGETPYDTYSPSLYHSDVWDYQEEYMYMCQLRDPQEDIRQGLEPSFTAERASREPFYFPDFPEVWYVTSPTALYCSMLIPHHLCTLVWVDRWLTQCTHEHKHRLPCPRTPKPLHIAEATELLGAQAVISTSHTLALPTEYLASALGANVYGRRLHVAADFLWLQYTNVEMDGMLF